MRFALLPAALLATTLSMPAMADTLTFPDGICSSAVDGSGAMIACGNYSRINQAHGDVAGMLDVSYTSVNSNDPASLMFWGPGYNTLPSAVFADGGDGASFARITLTPAAGQMVSLQGFDLGAFPNSTLNTHVRVFAQGGNSFSYDGMVGSPGGNATHFVFGNLHSGTGIVIEWENSAWNVGMNNIEYSLAPVPEPESYALMLAGLAVLGLMVKRRQG
ncbi:MAG: PEP-CTERM sorting domain-containing protein [Burkholderiaceae bacterium]|nr:PEP-CTERM sorting domain-containing protein [Burkholderiaceae bacterium]MBT9503366.1 PEP-CTERM sorting domain-containing protein [Burkholderiaceae bacterium]